MTKYYPIMLDIQGKKCIVVGGGRVAERKTASLLEHGAVVTVVSPQLTSGLQKLKEDGKITHISDHYQWGHLKDHYLAYVATDDEEVNALCLKEARQEEILINVVDKPDMCDFIVPAVVRRGDLTLTISTNGKSPMLARTMREELESSYGEVYKEYLNVLGELRQIILQEIGDIRERKKIFQALVKGDWLKQYEAGEIEDLREAMFYFYREIKRSLGGTK